MDNTMQYADNSKHETYNNPLTTRYASKEMIALFTDQKKFSTWRRCWIALAKAEGEMGLEISEDQIKELESFKDNINFPEAEEKEREIRHDVLSHIYAFGLQCPNAKPIIHLGATSAFVQDNTDLIISYEALLLIKEKLVNVIAKLKDFCLKYKELPTLGFTHFQPAQLVTVGKRAALWLQDLLMDYHEIDRLIENFKIRGVKGTTGTQASFLSLLKDPKKVEKLNIKVAKELGFRDTFTLTGQVYTRKFDVQLLNALAGIAISSHKFANDVRLLQHRKEMEEPFSAKQKGSSAMPYKRNPMRTERMCALSRYLKNLPANAASTAAVNWFERTLDDSAIRRIVLSQGFMACDAILNLYLNVMEAPVVYEKMIEKHVKEELPFMVTENIIMESVKKGGDRQELHGLIRDHAMEAGRRVKEEALGNDLLMRIANDPRIPMNMDDIDEITDVKEFVGLCPRQVSSFISEEIDPILKKNEKMLGKKSQVHV